MANIIIMDDFYYLMEIFGIINDKISNKSFSWDNASAY